MTLATISYHETPSLGGEINSGPEGTGIVMTIEDVIQCLRSAERLGAEQDEPEGTQYIQISHTLAIELVNALVPYSVHAQVGHNVPEEDWVDPKRVGDRL